MSVHTFPSRRHLAVGQTALVPHTVLYSWPDENINEGDCCLVRPGPVEPGQLIWIRARGFAFVSRFVRIDSEQTIYVQGSSNEEVRLTRFEYEIEGPVEEIRPRQLQQVQPTMILDEALCWGWAADGNGVIAPCPGWTRLTGLPPETANNWLERVHPDDRESNIRAWLKAQAGKTLFWHSHRVLNLNGQYQIVHNFAAPIIGLTGEIEGWSGISQTT